MCLVTPTLAAQPSEVDKDAARAAVQQGDERMAQKDYEGALEAYRRADDIMGVPTTSIEVGKVSMLLGQLVEAMDAFERAATHPVKKGEPEPFTVARRAAKDMAFQLRERIPLVAIRVKGVATETEVQVILDGAPVDVSESLRLNPGDHDVSAQADGYVSASEQFSLEEYDDRTVSLKLLESPATAWPMVWIGFGIAGASLIAGTATGIVSLNDASAAKDHCDGNDCTEAAREPLESSRTFADVSTALFVVSGIAAAVGTVGLIVSLGAEGQSDDGADAVEASILVDGAGAKWRLRF